jgi:hypothetical protein
MPILGSPIVGNPDSIFLNQIAKGARPPLAYPECLQNSGRRTGVPIFIHRRVRPPQTFA